MIIKIPLRINHEEEIRDIFKQQCPKLLRKGFTLETHYWHVSSSDTFNMTVTLHMDHIRVHLVWRLFFLRGKCSESSHPNLGSMYELKVPQAVKYVEDNLENIIKRKNDKVPMLKSLNIAFSSFLISFFTRNRPKESVELISDSDPRCKLSKLFSNVYYSESWKSIYGGEVFESEFFGLFDEKYLETTAAYVLDKISSVE